MNTLFCRVDRPVEFLGRINEDVSTYVVAGSRGDVFLTVLGVQMAQGPTQQNAGGMTELYLASGTYVKSFYTVMMAPSCVTVRVIASVGHRYHHRILWQHAVPKILSETHRKPRGGVDGRRAAERDTDPAADPRRPGHEAVGSGVGAAAAVD
jgi:hypothetical protein